ncbi:MAG: multidrug efflux RND transporter permease subunit [Myxococcales bacterium]|nr:multidrug efflux RND transporter permease subunit [Myxococcales bacterium]
MRLGHFFIERPRFSFVVSILIVVIGGLAYFALPVAQYPEIAPPTVQINASYPGATPQVLADTVATPIEEQVNGVEHMLYMSSQSTSDGSVSITVTFKQGTDLDTAQVLVQNRVALAEPRLPEEVRRTGVVVQKSSPDLMMVIHLKSPDQTFSQLYVSNYAILRVRDVLARVEGVGNMTIFGAREYGMRVWLDPDRLAALDLTAADVVGALQAQNVQVVGGALGQPPGSSTNAFQLTINGGGRFATEDQFEDVIVKTGSGGRVTRLKDVARVELGAQSYSSNSYLDEQPAVGIGIFQLPGSNLLETAANLRATIAKLAESFPKGLEYDIAYDPTQFVQESVHAVYETIFEAVLLVVLVIILFLQSWRAALIPIVAIPVSLIGTFAVMAALGFSLNNLSLFGLVLAIGLVVDDAIVVVENIERNLELGKTPREASHITMDEVGTALVSIALVLSAVFIPTAFIGGISGAFFRQFAVTIAAATIISAFNSLTLSPALGALVLRAKHEPAGSVGRFVDALAQPIYRGFNAVYDAGARLYMASLERILRWPKTTFVVFLALIALTAFVFQRVPRGFIPVQDQGYLIVAAQLPPGASLARTDDVVRRAGAQIRQVPGVGHAVEIVGFSGATFSAAPNAAAIFVTLKQFADRHGRDETSSAIAGKLWGILSQYQEAQFFVIEPPSVRGLGRGGGFKMMVEDRGGEGLATLGSAAYALMGAANQDPDLSRVFTTFTISTPEYDLDIDRTRAEMLGVPLQNVFAALATNFGSAYVNDFNRFGRSYRVTAQADAPFRQRRDDVRRVHVRNRAGEMVPLGSIVSLHRGTGTDRLVRYNLYPSVEVQGSAAPGVSSGTALEHMESLAKKVLPAGIGTEWTEIALQEKLVGNLSLLVFPLSVFFVFLLLTAQYESWSLPLSIILIVPLCVLFALAGVMLRGMDNNILTEIGFIVLIGLASKNAILIVEFAKQHEDEQQSSPIEAAIAAAKLRLRPILMTSMAFILGVVPLVWASGAGAEMRQALGTAVFSGMIGVTLVGLLLTPVFYVLVRNMVLRGERRRAARHGGSAGGDAYEDAPSA